VSGTVTTQAIGFPLAHGKRVVPSGRLLSSRIIRLLIVYVFNILLFISVTLLKFYLIIYLFIIYYLFYLFIIFLLL